MSKEPDFVDIETAETEKREATAKDRAIEREHEKADFRAVMSTPRGRRVVWRLMRGVFHDCSSNDPYEMARFLGERRQGLLLLNEVIEICPEHWLDMITDHKNRGPTNQKP